MWDFIKSFGKIEEDCINLCFVGSKADILSRIAQCTAAPVWNNQNMSLRSKVRLMRTLFISILLYARETFTLTTALHRRINAIEMRCYRRLSDISYKVHQLETKLRWFGHVVRSSGLCKEIIQGAECQRKWK